MKVIDLLNKIANGEEVPKKIKFNFFKYEFNEEERQYKRNSEDLDYGFGEDVILDIVLGDEVEIIGEGKKIKKIKVDYSPDIEEAIFYDDGDKPDHCILGDAGTKLLIDKINEIIDYINKEDK